MPSYNRNSYYPNIFSVLLSPRPPTNFVILTSSRFRPPSSRYRYRNFGTRSYSYETLVLLLTSEYDSDLGSDFAGCSQMCVTSNRCIPVKNTLGWIAVMSSEGELIRSFVVESCVVFCLVRVMYKFGSVLVVNWTPKKWQTLASDRDLSSWQKPYVFSASFVPELKRLPPALPRTKLCSWVTIVTFQPTASRR